MPRENELMKAVKEAIEGLQSKDASSITNELEEKLVGLLLSNPKWLPNECKNKEEGWLCMHGGSEEWAPYALQVNLKEWEAWEETHSKGTEIDKGIEISDFYLFWAEEAQALEKVYCQNVLGEEVDTSKPIEHTHDILVEVFGRVLKSKKIMGETTILHPFLDSPPISTK